MKAKSAGKKIMVSVVMGSDSDLPVMTEAAKILDEFGIGYELVLTSAHRRRRGAPGRCYCLTNPASRHRRSH